MYRPIAFAAFAFTVPTMAATPAFAQEESRPAANPAHEALAASIVGLSTVEAQIEPLLEATAAAMLAQDPELARLEEEYPGLKAAFMNALRPVMIRGAKQTTPLYQADLAALFAEAFSPAQALEMTAFIEDPRNRRFFAAVSNSVDYRSVAKEIVAEKEAISASAVQSDISAAARNSVKTLSPADFERFAKFFSTPTGQRFMSIRAKKLAIDTKWANYSPPGLEDEVEQVVIESMVAHIGKTDPELAEAMRDELDKEKAPKPSEPVAAN